MYKKQQIVQEDNGHVLTFVTFNCKNLYNRRMNMV